MKAEKYALYTYTHALVNLRHTNMGDDTDLKIPRIAIITLNENKYYYKNYWKSYRLRIVEPKAHL